MILPSPMLVSERRGFRPFDQPGWLYEIKYDGYRLLAVVDSGEVRLGTKSGVDCSKWFPEVARGLATIPGGPHVLDGEVCVLDDLGRADWERTRARASRRRWLPECDPVVYCAFDLLARDGRSLISMPLEARKAQLRELLTPAPPSVLYVDHFGADEGAEVFRRAKVLKLEGLVAKRLGSTYQPGVRSPDWVKVKVPGAVKPGRFSRRP